MTPLPLTRGRGYASYTLHYLRIRDYLGSSLRTFRHTENFELVAKSTMWSPRSSREAESSYENEEYVEPSCKDPRQPGANFLRSEVKVSSFTNDCYTPWRRWWRCDIQWSNVTDHIRVSVTDVTTSARSSKLAFPVRTAQVTCRDDMKTVGKYRTQYYWYVQCMVSQNH